VSSTTGTPSACTTSISRGAATRARHDLTAETFAQAWLGRTRFEDVAGGSAGPWLFAIGRHVLSASVRRGRLERAACTRFGILDRLDREPAAVEPQDTWLEGLDEALAELPETQLIGTDDVEQSLPAGTLSLAGTNPTCTVVEQGIEYLCVLEHAPAPEVSDWKGTVEPTVDATKHVNGGCRSLTSDGRNWRCYVGQAAIDQQIIGPDFLGEYAPSPGVG
jgi:hypothetical protein